jgi:hypothetical protein
MIGIVEPLSYGKRELVVRPAVHPGSKVERGTRVNAEENPEDLPPLAKVDESDDLSLNVSSVAVQRLIEEIRSTDSAAVSASYNRTHNRHNR